jgi:hypothetical protein
MFNVPFNFREGYSSGDPIPVFGSAKAVFWVDALKGVYNGLPYVPAALNNTDIRFWQDQTIYGNHLTATTVSSPSYSATTFAPYGSSSSYPFIQFNDLNTEHMAATNSASLQAISTGFTIFFVIRKNPLRTWSSGNPIIEYNAAWGSESEGFGVDGDAGPNFIDMWYFNQAFNPTKISVPWGSGGIDDEKFFYYTYRMSGGTCTGYAGATLKDTAIAGGGNKKMMPVSSTAKLYIAGGYNGSTYAQASAIDVAEVLIYDGAVPNAGLITVWNYFKSKYGFTT